MVLKTIAAALLALLATGVAAQDSPTPPSVVTAALSSTSCPGTGCVTAGVAGFGTVAVQLTGFGTATAEFEGSVDGTTFVSLNSTPINGSTAVTNATANGVWVAGAGGLRIVRVRLSAFTAGPIAVTIQTALSGGGSGGGGGGGGSSDVTVHDPNTPANKVAVNGSGQMSITCANCSGSGASAVDNSVFTAGTTSGAPAMGFFHSTIDTVTDGRTATLAMDSKRSLFGVIRDAALNNRGANVTAGNALQVDASATTQPISAAALPLPTGAATSGNQATEIASLANLDVALSTRLKPADTLTKVTTVDTITNAVAVTESGTWTVQPGNTANTTPWLATIAQGGNSATVSAGGALKVDGSAVTQPVSGTFFQATQPVSGTVTANQGGAPWTVTGTGTAGTAATGVLTVQGIASMTKLLVTPDSVALPANQSVNMAQVAGTTTDTNSGTKSAGTLRVVLATDQPALTNKLLVTPDSVALPANQSVNISQINAVTPLMGAGATGTGALRVNDVASSATGAAPPTSAQYIGGLGSGATGGFVVPITVCDTNKPITITSATTTLMVTGVSGRQVRICALSMVTAIANNVAIIEGTGATCGTGTAGVMGGTTAANGFNFAANGGLTIGSGIGEIAATATTGDSVCIITSAAGPLAGFIKYAIY